MLMGTPSLIKSMTFGQRYLAMVAALTESLLALTDQPITQMIIIKHLHR